MGKKTKTGKTRKDKFYQLAKESGYRSRAAFKLLQLNRSYHFLEKARVCIDLCAAPGGWLQVAAANMPMSSILIGVDLASIKPIANVITHQEDITTAKCRQTLKSDLNEMKADVVLHDGAPNVGKNWLFDAYQQNILVLQSFKLASEFLKKGGCFVTKIFRSKDYYAILWIFQQFFKKVESTKPQASRNESAEIFVVCQNYLAPEKIDPKFFDIKFVFSEVDNNLEKTAADLFKNDFNTRHRGGYPEGDMTLYHRLNATDFLKSDTYMERLANSNEIVLDDDAIANHVFTTVEVKECIKDIKVLGKNEIKILLKWREKLREEHARNNEEKKAPVEEKETVEEKKTTDDGDEIDEQISATLDYERKLDKKKRKKNLKEKAKLKTKIILKMDSNDNNDFHLTGDNELFSLNAIKTKKQLIELQPFIPGLRINDMDEEFEENEDFEDRRRPNAKKIKFTAGEGLSEDEDNNIPFIKQSLANNFAQRQKNQDLWYEKDSFDFMKELTEEQEYEKITDQQINSMSNSTNVKKKSPKDNKKANKKKGGQFAEVPQVKLTPEELSVGEAMINSKKTKSDLLDDSFNRYSGYGDNENLPDWFNEDEEMNCRKEIMISNIFKKEGKNRKDINANPIKKVVEAEARKKKRMGKKLDRARRKAETISDNLDMTDKEISKEIKSVYKKAGLISKKKIEVKYVVSKKGFKNSQSGKQPYKVVDPRLKKDKKNMKTKLKKQKGKGRK